MLLGLAVVGDGYQEEVACVAGYLLWIVLVLDLADGRLGIFVAFQLHDECRRVDVLAGNEHKVSKAFPCGQLAVNDIVVLSEIVGEAAPIAAVL